MKLIKISLVLVAMMVALGTGAQMTPRSIFETAPVEVLPTIDRSTRLDMLDYAENGMRRASKDIFGEDVLISEIDPNGLTLELAGGATVDFCILPAGKAENILVIRRVSSPAVDSQIEVYNSRWEPLSMSKILKMPGLDDWLLKVDRERRADIENALPFIMVNATYDPASATLTLTPDLTGYVDRENVAMVKSALRPSLTYTWNGKRFTLNKQK